MILSLTEKNLDLQSIVEFHILVPTISHLSLAIFYFSLLNLSKKIHKNQNLKFLAAFCRFNVFQQATTKNLMHKTDNFLAIMQASPHKIDKLFIKYWKYLPSVFQFRQLKPENMKNNAKN